MRNQTGNIHFVHTNVNSNDGRGDRMVACLSPCLIEGVHSLVEGERSDEILSQPTRLWLHLWRDVSLQSPILTLNRTNLGEGLQHLTEGEVMF